MAPLSHDCFPAHRVAKPPCSSSHFLSRSTNQSPPLHPLPQICIKFLLHTALPLFKTATRLFSDHRCTQCAPLCTQCAPGQPPPKCNNFTLSPTHAQHVCTFTHPPRSQISYQAFNQQYHDHPNLRIGENYHGNPKEPPAKAMEGMFHQARLLYKV